MSNNNTDESFTNVKGKTNFPKKNEENLLSSIEPETNLGFLSRNRDADISDLFYVRDAIEIDKNIESMMRAQEEEELARFRMSSIYRPALSSSKQMGSINIQKQDKGESASFSTKVQMKLTKKRKITEEDANLRTSNPTHQEANVVVNSTVVVESTNSISTEEGKGNSGESNNALFSLVGAYDDEDSD